MRLAPKWVSLYGAGNYRERRLWGGIMYVTDAERSMRAMPEPDAGSGSSSRRARWGYRAARIAALACRALAAMETDDATSSRMNSFPGEVMGRPVDGGVRNTPLVCAAAGRQRSSQA